MKICVLTHTFPRNKSDVAAAFMKEFCDGLVENGNEVIVLAPYDEAFYREHDKFKILTYKYIWPGKLHLLGYSRSMEADIKLRKINYLLLPFMMFFGTIALYNLVKRENVDLISVHWILPSGLMALIVSRLLNIPYTITLPGTDAYLAYKSKIFGLIAKIIARDAKGLYSNSKWHLERILSLGVNNYIQVITYPVDTDYFKPSLKDTSLLRSKYALKKDGIILLAVGRLVYKKGFEYLIEAIPEVIKKYPNIKLLIGGDGDLYYFLDKLIRKMNLQKNIQLVGTIKRNEIKFYYNLADIIVTPSVVDSEGNVDGRPLVILESMACGKPQVVTNLPGISDSLENGVNALLVPQKDPHSLAKALIKLISDNKLRQSMGKVNRQLAIDLLSTKRVGEKYTESFKKILDFKS